jgi:creatinine amidohydrolase
MYPEYRYRYLASLTGDQLAALKLDRALAIIPTGSIEQHGPHLPVGVDSILGQAWLTRALPLLPADAPVWVAPALTYGKSNEHAGFPGTLSLSAISFRALLLAQARQLAALGFRSIAVFNTHGGNSSTVTMTLREIQTTLGLRAVMLGFNWQPDLSPQEAAYGFHAGEFETSLMLACAPELTRMELASCDYPARLDDPGLLRPEAAPATFSWISSDISSRGVMGDATVATREKGEAWFREGSAALAREILRLLAALEDLDRAEQ